MTLLFRKAKLAGGALAVAAIVAVPVALAVGSDTMVSIEGENLRPVTWVVVEEIKSGDWGLAGNPLTTGAVKALAAGKGKA